MSGVIRIVARVFLAELFLVCVYRAITQSITHDEALTWELYLHGPASAMFQHFDANHHFLNTILMRISVFIFGVSEWSLRLPALAGAALYFTAVDRLARFFGDRWAYLMAVLLMALNPFVLDFMVAARGYGMALALWMWALALIAEQQPKRALLAGTALALSVTANLVFLPPAAALAAMGIYLLTKRAPAPEASKKKRATQSSGVAPWILFSVPSAAIAILYVLLAPVENASMENFYVGAATIADSVRSLTKVSLAHSGPYRDAHWNEVWQDVVGFGIAPLIAALGLLVGYRRRDVLMLLCGGTMVISVAGLISLHLLFDRPYPADRTGIYFLPLIGLVLAGLAHREKYASIVSYALGLAVVAQFATEFNTRKFLLWEYDADTRSIAQAISSHRDTNTPVVHAGASWQLSEALYFYASKYGWSWLEITNKPSPGLDFYALVMEDRGLEPGLGISEIYEGPVSHSVLAVPKGR